MPRDNTNFNFDRFDHEPEDRQPGDDSHKGIGRLICLAVMAVTATVIVLVAFGKIIA